MPFLFHIDLKSLYFYASLLQDGVLNIYGYMSDYKSFLSYKQVFVYPPPIYFLQGLWLITINPLLGSGFYKWINDWGVGTYNSDFLFRYLFILKIPNLILDVLIGLLLYKIVETKYRVRALIIWFFNPLTLYINYGLANFDIVPTFLVVLSLYFYKEKKLLKSGMSLGAATAFKVFPFILWPFFIFSIFKLRGREEMLKFILSVLASFFLLNFPWPSGIVPVYNSSLTNRAFELTIPFFNFPLPLSNILLISLFGLFVFKKDYSVSNITKFIFIALLILLSITAFHPQWWIWVLPFLTILAAQNLLLLVLFIPLIIFSALLIIGLNDQFITVGILNPLISSINDNSFLFDFIYKSHPDQIKIISKYGLIFSALILIIVANLKPKLKLFSLSDKHLFIVLFMVTLLSCAGFLGLGIVGSSTKVFVAGYENFDKTTPIYKDHGYMEEINVTGSKIHLVNLNFKNPNARNIDPFNIKFETPEGEKREFHLTGGNIGDGVWVNLRINPIDIKDKLKVTLDSPTESTSDAVLVLTSHQNKMSYKLYKRENPINGLIGTLNAFLVRIIKDQYFLTFFIVLNIILLAALSATLFKRRH